MNIVQNDKLAQKKGLSDKQKYISYSDAQKMTDLKDHSFDLFLANMCVMDIKYRRSL